MQRLSQVRQGLPRRGDIAGPGAEEGWWKKDVHARGRRDCLHRLRCLERGTLQNQLFDDPGRLSQKAMRGIAGGFLRLPPVKKALMTDTLRSRFLSSIAAGTARAGKADVLEL